MLRFKRFISHRRKSQSLDSGRNSFEDLHFTDTKLHTHTTKGLSAVAHNPSVEIPAPRRSNSQATLRTYHNRTASTTAHSSATSLCSCDCAANPVSIERPLSKDLATTDRPEILYLPPLSPDQASDDAQTWHLRFSESPSRSPAPSTSRSGQKAQSTAIIAPGSNFDHIGALALESEDEDETPTQSLNNTCDSEMEDLSDNVEQLIRETDAAFQAVGNALADAKAATRGWYDDDVPVARKSSVARSIFRKNQRSLVSPIKSQMSRSSVSIAKKKKPAKRKLLGRALRSASPPSESTPLRWTVNDVTTNIVDVFSGKIFRTEVDEMLTPVRLQQLQENNRVSQEHRESADLTRGAETDEDVDTPIEPFHLQSLSDRLDAAKKNHPPSPNPVLPPPAIPQRHPNRPSIPKPRKVQFANQSQEEAEMTFNELTFPTPPRISISRHSSTSSNIPHLPTIPEISPLTLSTTQHFIPVPSILQPPHLQPKTDEKYIFLPSTPFTLTSPLFRHNAIRVPIPYREPKVRSSDEALDWTAFQMAISGTSGIDTYLDDFETREGERIELGEMEREADDILQWWTGFGYQGWGRMVGDERLNTHESGRREALPHRKRREDIEHICAQEARSSPRYNEHLKIIIDTEKIVVAHNNPDADGFEVQRRRSLAESLPASPMLDLVGPGLGKDNEVIPMGFNLGHDLGDFLRWETDHVQLLM
jgi:hypothetical protein